MLKINDFKPQLLRSSESVAPKGKKPIKPGSEEKESSLRLSAEAREGRSGRGMRRSQMAALAQSHFVFNLIHVLLKIFLISEETLENFSGTAITET